MATVRYLFSFILISISPFYLTLNAISPQNIIERVDRQRYEFPQEKAYVMTDKANYIGGDTIWFRGFVLDAASHQPVKVSRYLYVELSDPFGDVTQRVMIKEKDGIYSGYIPLGLDIADGEYQLTAYTTFMRSQRSDYFPKKSLHINNLMALKNEIRYDWNTDTRRLSLDLIDRASKEPAKYEKLTLFTDGGKVFTPASRRGKASFTITPEALKRGYVKVTYDGYNRFIKLDSNDNDNYDLTFHPEGGYLIPDTECVLAFKAIGKDGKGVPVYGKIINSNGTEIKQFTTLHAGMGRVNFTPKKGETYKAATSDGKEFPLPQSNELAAVLQAKHLSDDTISINVAGNLDNGYLILQQRGIVLWASEVNSDSSFKFAKSDALSGIMQALLLDKDLNTLSERLIFCINDADNPEAILSVDNINPKNRDKVKVITEMPNTGTGDFAVSVIDNNMSVVDSTLPIKAHLLLTSDIKGYVENPEYYFTSDNPEIPTAIDNLMLTQGWTRYDIPEILKGNFSSPAFPIEKSMSLSGIVKSQWRGKPLKDISLGLMSPTTGYANLSVSDADGRFKFDGFEYPDGNIYYVQAVNNKGGFEDNIMIDSINYPDIDYTLPKNGNTDYNLWLPDLKNRIDQSPELKSILLSEVVITELALKNRENWFSGIASSVVDTSDPQLRDINSVEDAIMRLNGISVSGSGNITYQGRPVGVFIDNFPLESTVNLGMSNPESFDFNTRALKSRTKMFRQSTLSNPKGYIDMTTNTNLPEVNIINEINNVCNYDNIASIAFVRGGASAVIGNRAPGGTIIIKTKDGNSFAKIREHNPHIAIARPLGYQKAAEFYSPKYEPTERPDGTDLRSTIYWNPCVRIGDDGKADFEFFTSDNPSTSYTIFIEGITDDGRIITGSSRIEVK